SVVFSLLILPRGKGTSHVFAGTERGGLHYSSDSGEKWEVVGGTLRPSDVISLSSDDTHLYAGTHKHAVWRRPLIEMIDSSVGPPVPSRLMLYQNYPNPYTPTNGSPHTVI